MSGQWVEHLWEERYNLDITANSESMVTTCTFFSLSEQVRNVSLLLSECLGKEQAARLLGKASITSGLHLGR